MKNNFFQQIRERSVLLKLLVAAISLGSGAALAELEVLPNPSYYGWARGVSWDGNTIVGMSGREDDSRYAFVYNAKEIVDITPFNDTSDFPYAESVSADGSIITGSHRVNWGEFQAFLWTRSKGLTPLNHLSNSPIDYSRAYSISTDGSVISGEYSTNGKSTIHAFKWVNGSIIDLGTLGGSYSVGNSVNYDGSVIVGKSELSDGNYRAFKWTPETGMQSLGTMGGSLSWASDISSDGAIIVGASTISDNPRFIHYYSRYHEGGINKQLRAFIWTEESGFIRLGHANADAQAISGNGEVVIGEAEFEYGGRTPFVWNKNDGMITIYQWLENNGIEYTGSIRAVSDINYDGSVIVGMDGNYDPFVVRTPTKGIILLSEISDSLTSTSQGISTILRSTSTLTNGAHSNPLSRYIAKGEKTFWATGNFAKDNHENNDGSIAITEVGFGKNLGLAQVNISIGKSRSDHNLILGGDINFKGSHLMLEGIIPFSGNYNLFATVGAFHQWGELDIRRGYLLSTDLTEHSYASPDTTSYGFRARLDWVDAFSFKEISFTPYSDFRRTYANMKGYTEIDGSFPAVFEERSEFITEVRVGFNAEKLIENTNTQILGSLETTHRFDNYGARTKGKQIGLFDFDLEGYDYNSNWVSASLGIETLLSNGKASLLLHSTTEGEVPSTWVTASYQINF